jgi:hypothetical protein
MKKTLISSIAAAVLSTGVLFSATVAAQPTEAVVIRCGANRGMEAFCPADTRQGVTLVRQLSRAGCWKGTTWGTNRRGIWVANGCRADFAVAQPYAVRREVYGRPPVRVAGGGDRNAALALGLLGIAAIASNRDWDDDDRYAYVGRHRIYDRYDRYHDQYWTPYERQRPAVIRCESIDHQFRSCAAPTSRGVEIYRQISRTPCRFRTNWGYDARGIWVDEGCAAEFVVRR